MGIEDLLNGEELIIKQNTAIKELPSKGLKEFCPNNSWIEKKQIEKKLEDKFNFINTDRIEKSNNISLAEWVPHLGKAKVLKKVGKFWEIIGHHQDSEDWLLPEEVLFLVENCELHLILDSVSASIEDCYALLLQEECCTLDEYRVYSYLCRAGLRVVRHAPSITVTPYEQQVNLDVILQRCKRSPPRTSGVKPIQNEENEVTIIDEEIKSFSKLGEKEENTVLYNIKQDVDLIEVIEIDDDVDPKPIVEEVLDSSNDSSDIVCISSPSYISTDHSSRLWYPTIQKSLLRSVEKVIDLCSEESPNDFKELIHNKLDLIKVSRAEVLSYLPSAENSVSVIHSPDSRLLPNNIVPRYSEYKVNLNVRSDYNAQKNFRQDYSTMHRIPLTNMMGSTPISPEFMNNPLFKKAEEMQAMAMNMIQTASTLMSVLGSNNPNELWNFVDARNHDVSPYFPRFSVMQQQRPYYRFPRRYYRASRRRNPYEKRSGGRFFRRSYEFNQVSNNVELPSAITDSSSEVKIEVVVLSDDEDYINKDDSLPCDLNNGKRKKINLDVTCKKLKHDNSLDSTSLLKESTRVSENTMDLDIKTKSETNETIEVIENGKNIITKEKCISLKHHPNIDDSINGQSEMDYVDYSSQTFSIFPKNDKNENIETERNNKLHEPYHDVEQSRNLPRQEMVADILVKNEQNFSHETSCSSTTETKIVQNFSDSLLDNTNKTSDVENGDIDSRKKDKQLQSSSFVSTEERLSCSQVKFRPDNTLRGKITCWEEYKSTEDSHLGVNEEFIEDPDSLLKLKKCTTYGDILTTLQIFKEVDITKSKKKFKITFDVYLPEANFRKSMKVLPNFRVIVSKSCEELPTPMDLKCLKVEYKDQIPFLFSVVFNETVGFYLYDAISLPCQFE